MNIESRNPWPIRLSPEERAVIGDAAKAANLPPTTWARAVLVAIAERIQEQEAKPHVV